MWPPHTRLTILSFSSLAYAVNFNCNEVKVGKDLLDLSPLGGPHSVHRIEEHSGHVTNWTFTVDLCKPLRKTKGVKPEEECPNGTRVCGIKYLQFHDNSTKVDEVVPVAGHYIHDGRDLDPHIEPFKGSGSHKNAEKDGFTLTLNGGRYPDTRKGEKQKAIIEFQCDESTEGLTGDEPDDRAKEPNEDETKKLRRDIGALKHDDDDDDEEDGDEHDDTKGKDLRFVSYKEENDDVKILRLDWQTKYACPGKHSGGGGSSGKKGGYSFFGSFIIILFLAIAAYLIFGSWLNYNRYGARGWDLVPHGDTIRDIPYLMKDWGRRVVNTVQGPGPRGGYSAV